VVPLIAEEHKKRGGVMVLRPDSGDPVDCVMMALKAGEATFGAVKNEKGYKVLNGVNTIQGDGINIVTVGQILDAALTAGYSAQNIAFGMGGGLLQRCNRDTMSFATKLSLIQYRDGTIREVMKRPKTDSGKISFPGILRVQRIGGRLMILPVAFDEKVDEKTNELRVVYNRGPVAGAFPDDFDTVRRRVREQWAATPAKYDPVSAELKAKIAAWIRSFDESYAKTIAAD